MVDDEFLSKVEKVKSQSSKQDAISGSCGGRMEQETDRWFVEVSTVIPTP